MTTETAADPKEALFSLLHPIFREFVDPDQRRYDLSAPFVVDGFVYATDGRAAVRSLATPEIEAAAALVPAREGSRRIKDFSTFFDPADRYEPEPFPLPDPDLSPCPACKGVGSVPESVCDDCNGTGKEKCECCGQDTECSECDGAGRLPAGTCDDCAGHGFGGGWNEGEPVKAGTSIAHAALIPLRRHGAVAYLPVPFDAFDAKRAVRFTVDPGVEGRLMLMRPPAR